MAERHAKHSASSKQKLIPPQPPFGVVVVVTVAATEVVEADATMSIHVLHATRNISMATFIHNRGDSSDVNSPVAIIDTYMNVSECVPTAKRSIELDRVFDGEWNAPHCNRGGPNVAHAGSGLAW